MRRRDSLRIGGLAGFFLANPLLVRRANAVQAQPSPAVSGKASNCILIWLDGGPSHLETFDVKPDAPAEVRGPLEAIATSVPGINISECLPLTALRMQHFAVIRSMTSPLGEHNLGAHYVLTGYQPSPVLEYPSFHAAAGHLRSPSSLLPANIAIPNYRIGGQGFSGGGYLPGNAKPFSVGGDPAAADFKVLDLALREGLSVERIERRREFAEQVRRLRDSADASGLPSPSSSLARAFDLLTSTDAQRAFDLSEEPVNVRQRYGSRMIGQSCLLARRLVERGVPFVTVNNTGWDTHANLYTSLKEGYTGAREPVGLIPLLDQALSALIEDLQDRGLLEQTLVLVMGEFGRTPKLNAAAGRDHWPRAFSVALAGGGIRGGQVYGESDRTGEVPADKPVTPSDLVCTIYSQLGIDPNQELITGDGRPVRLTPPGSKLIPIV